MVERRRTGTPRGAPPTTLGVAWTDRQRSAPERVFVAISADFDDALPMGEAETLIERIEAKLKEALPQLSSIYIRPEKREDAEVVVPA